ncbi:MAG: PAS domain S-box protein [Desulfobulbaceae bacterium]|nr:PAS domain S-box protein [Candidatus Kapabacteria bacterium]MBS3998885.1 PAS domain S-box protein [Desulfobulbaceae bacterium]
MKKINPWGKENQNITLIFQGLFKKPTEQEEEILRQVKLDILNYIIRLGIIVGALSLLSGIILSFEIADPSYGVFIFLIYLTLLSLLLIKKEKYILKSNILLIGLFTLSVYLLFKFGPDSAATLWMLTFLISTTILKGGKGAIIAFGLVIFVLIAYSITSDYELLDLNQTKTLTTLEILTISFDLILLSAIISVSLLLLIKGLTSALILSKESKDKLTEQMEIGKLAIDSLREEIADRIVVEKELTYSERRLQNVQSIAKIASWELDLNKTLYWGTEEYFKIIGMEPDTGSISYSEFKQLCHEEDRPLHSKAIDSLQNGGEDFDIRYRIFRASDGEMRWIRSIGEIVKDSYGYPLRITGTMQDITKDMLLQQEIIQSEAQFRALFNQASVAILLLDKMQFIDCNPKAEQLFGFSRDVIVGLTPDKLSPKFQGEGLNSLKIAQEYVTRALDGESLTFEWKHLKNGNEMIDVEVSLNRIPIRDSFILQAFLIDITDRKQYERRIIEINKELENRVAERTKQLETALNELSYENEERKRTQIELVRTQDDLLAVLTKEKSLNELKSRFIAMVSHEYRTPLTVILSSTYILDKLYEMNDEISFKKNLELIRHSIQSLTKLLDDVLVFEKPTTKDWQVTYNTIELCSFIGSIIDEIKMTIGKNRIVNVKCANKKILIECDQISLRNIISNLVANALKYSSEDTSVDISIFDNQTSVNMQIKDYGIGIPANEMESVFDPFHRSRNVGNKPGTGLGLAIVKKYVELINGTITFESEEGKGTTFILKFDK